MNAKQLATLHRVRDTRRDQARQLLARVLEEARSIQTAIRSAEAERENALGGLKASLSAGRIDVDRAAAFRLEAVRRGGDVRSLAQRAESHSRTVRQVQALLAQSDRQVRVVERLQEIERRERERAETIKSDREATDRFSASRLADDATGLR